MLNLIGTTDKLQVITNAALAVSVVASYVDYTQGASSAVPGNQKTAIATATTTDVVGAPGGATVSRNVKGISINPTGGSQTVTVQLNAGGTLYPIITQLLQTGDALIYDEGVGWYVRSANYTRRSILVADQAVPVALTAINNSVLDATNLKAGTVFKWRVTMTKTAAGLASQTFDVRFGTAGTTADTARLSGWATGTQTAAIDTAEFEVIATVRSVSATGTVNGLFSFTHNLATTGFAPAQQIIASTTSATFDTTAANLKATLCTTPGTSAAVTVTSCVSERIDP